MKFFDDKDEFIESELSILKDKLEKNLDKLPNEELPFMEQHLRALYFQIYFLVLWEFYNASLVLMGILLECVTKERLSLEGIEEEELEEMDFGKAISKCVELKILNSHEINFLKNRKNRIRNPYLHYNKMKLSKDVYFPVAKIKNPVEKLIGLSERVSKGEITEEQARMELIKGASFKPTSSKEFKPIAQLAKSEIEKEQTIPIFLEIDEFIRKFAKKYFKPKK